MAHARWVDIIGIIIALAVAGGVYGLFLLNGQQTLGTTFAMIILVGFFIFYCCLSGVIKSMIQGRSFKKYTSTNPQVQEGISFDEFKYCIRCNSEMKKEVKICTKCGQPFQL
ncbi:hypothetical protein LCGC14_0935770 [marine sediment metagenome]|uniref:Zinc-ribbon domain-containing protein n=1 Tax=marine sediment metagenome TaxID=412755 RepID=A0A0F9NLN2_9ZZZZ